MMILYTDARAEARGRRLLCDVELLVALIVSVGLLWAQIVLRASKPENSSLAMLAPLVSFVSLAGAVLVTKHSIAIETLARWMRSACPFPHWEASAELASMHGIAMPIRAWANYLLLGGPSIASLVVTYGTTGRPADLHWTSWIAASLAAGAFLVLWKGHSLQLPGFEPRKSSEPADSAPSNERAAVGHRSIEGSNRLKAMILLFPCFGGLFAALAFTYRALGNGGAFALVVVALVFLIVLDVICVALFFGQLPSAAFERIVVKVLRPLALMVDIFNPKRGSGR
ncbi:MAG TPA: hypothetical protein VJT73_21030 [Polyangiaceae bacterium]|nr:hypothetical protein [Polyangiaceae bacterium]